MDAQTLSDTIDLSTLGAHHRELAAKTYSVNLVKIKKSLRLRD